MEMKPGYKMTEVGVIPEDWEVVSLATVTPPRVKNGIVDGPFGSNLKTIHYRSSGVPIITSGFVTNGKFCATNYIYVDKDKFLAEKRSTVTPGDIVMAKIGERCGASAILPLSHEIGILSGNALKISVDQQRNSTVYIWQWLWYLYCSGKTESLKTTGAQPAISMSNLKKYKIVLPAKFEQEAIAAALSDADALIESLEQLIAKKRNIKQGAMQELLTGKRRLPGFTGEWETKSLDSIAFVTSGKRLPLGSFLVNQETPHPYIRVTDMRPGTVSLADIKFVPENVFPAIRQFRIFTGDIFISVAGTLGIVGKIPMQLDGANLTENADRITNITCSQDYLLFVLMSPIIQNVIEEMRTVGAQPKLALARIRKFSIPLPPTIPEQEAIATVLFDMEAEITTHEVKLSQACQIKQGMMQELLTGRIRLV